MISLKVGNETLNLTEEEFEEIKAVFAGVWDCLKSGVEEFKKDPYYKGLLDGIKEKHLIEAMDNTDWTGLPEGGMKK